MGVTDGYFANAAIKILMPEKLRGLEKGLRMMGKGPGIDSFVMAMNRAAEKAAPGARNIFLNAITGMSFEDARGIWQAATRRRRIISNRRPPVLCVRRFSR